MTNREFITEAVRRLVPDTSWHGECYLDGKSLDNLDILMGIIEIALDELTDYCIVPEGNKRNGSFEAIAEKKQRIISWVLKGLADYSILYDIKERDDYDELKELNL